MAWYDSSKLLSHNKNFNFVIGNRGGGKTYNFKLWCIRDFLKNGKEFVWVRRYKSELKTVKQFFSDVQHLFPNKKLEVKGGYAYCDGKLMGYIVPMSVSTQFKSVSYPNVNKIIVDEFLIMDGATVRYLTNEVEVFHELYETVARKRDDVRAVFIGNAISIVNPYFTYYQTYPNLTKRFTVKNEIVIELFSDADFIEEKQNTKFGRLIGGTKYGDYAINNNFLCDSETFIEDKSSEAKFHCGIKYLNTVYGIWVDYNEGLMYVHKKYDKNSSNIFSLTTKDHEPNLILISMMKKSRPIKAVKLAFETGNMRFQNQDIKHAFYEYWHLIK